MSWENMYFIDFVLLQRGYDLTKAKIKPGNYPVVTSTSIMGHHNAFKAEGPGVITGRSGTIGEVQYIKENYWPHNTCLYVKNFKGNYPRFVYYFLKNFGTARAKSGSAVPTLNRNNLSKILVKIPDIETQRRIASILSAYDNLIENNQKQIKLLEEAAQRLYKEWFVDLRFPGHENVKIVDGVPEGWKTMPLGEAISFEIGGGWGEESATEKNECEAYVIRGTDFDGLKNGCFLNIPLRFHTEKNLSSRKLQHGDIVFEVSGGSRTEGVARTVRITNSMLKRWDKPVMCASFCKLIRPLNDELAQYLFDYLRYLRAVKITEEYDKRSASSIVNYRWKDFLRQRTLLYPKAKLLNQYNKIAVPLYEKIATLSLQIETVKSARNRLLPKLMSGEIEV